MHDLEFEHTLRQYVANARARLKLADEKMENADITLNCSGVDAVKWRIYKYGYGAGSKIDVHGADLGILVNDFVAAVHRAEANKELRALTYQIPAEPATPKGDDNARASQDETTDD